MANQPFKILLIEDNRADATLLAEALTKEHPAPFTLTHAERLASGLDHLSRGGIDLVLLDLQLPDSHGIETLIRARARAPKVPIVVLTASDDDVLAVQALQKGAQDYLVKGYIQVYRNLLGRSIRYAVERKRAEEELRGAHAQNEELLASITSILIRVNTDGVVTYWNAVAERTFGLRAADMLGRPLSASGIQWDMARVMKSLSESDVRGDRIDVDDVPFARASGEEGFLGIAVIPMKGDGQARAGFLLFGADITDRKHAEAERLRLQEQLGQAQKMETFGRFAGGIAHDFQNFLQVILGFAWLIRSRYRENHELISDLQEIVHAAESASGMVRQLLAFSRRQALQLQLIDLNETVRGMGRLLQQFVGEAIHIEISLASTPLMVKVDPTSFEQILMNLSGNARDSMAKGGTLTLRTERVEVGEAFLTTRSWAKSGDYVRLSVKDAGTGMDPNVAARIFEPFFTTKPTGRGTGLGLAVVYGLVKQHGGFIDIETAPGQGTAFHLYFPYSTATAGVASGPSATAPKKAQAEHILLVEHDDRIRGFAEEILRESGYQTSSFSEEAKALELFGQRAAEIDVVIWDASLPLSSVEVIARIRQIRSDAKVLLVSGFLDERLRTLEASVEGVRVLQKPYVPAQFLDALVSLLDQAVSLSSPPASSASSASSSAERTDKRGKVLVVDDDSSIRLFCEWVLRESYDVTIVSSGRSALEALARTPYDLLLTDVMMPEMDGFALIAEALKVRPTLKMAIMTGSLTSETVKRMLPGSLSCEVLQKPFSAAALKASVTQSF